MIHNIETLDKKTTTHKEHTDSNFDPEFYLNEYPETKTYYQFTQNISQTEKLYHHYIHYGRHEGRFKNKTEKYKHTNLDILKYVGLDDIKYISNKLECICLLVTDKEISNGSYNKFIEMLLTNTEQSDLYEDINFYIVANNLSNKNIEQINQYNPNKVFKNIKTINLEIDKSEDCYIKNRNDSIIIPRYGLKSGPNIAFFKTIELCQKYNTTLLLETDCILSPDWLIKLINYTRYANGFLISGAMYDGTVFVKANSQMKTHINGGTGLYATGDKVLQQLIVILAQCMEKQIADNIPGLAYDYALKLLIDNNLDLSMDKSPKEKDIWQFIHRNYLHCKAIINCSCSVDAAMNPKELYDKYEYAVLHKK